MNLFFDNMYEAYNFIIRIPIVLIALSVHEAAHGYAAYRLGDPTAKNFGRLSLNPLRHLDPIGAICMFFFGFGWAKPVPINTRYFKKPRRDMAISALAGPLSNLLMSFGAYIIYSYLWKFPCRNGYLDLDIFGDKVVYLFSTFFLTFFWMNLYLAVFNLFPIPPLDGSRILFVLLPDRLYFGLMKYERYISIALISLLWIGIFDKPLLTVVGFFETAFAWIVQFLPFL